MAPCTWDTSSKTKRNLPIMTTPSHGISLALCRLARKDVVLDIQPYTQGIKTSNISTYHYLQSSGWNRLFPGFERILRIEVYWKNHVNKLKNPVKNVSLMRFLNPPRSVWSSFDRNKHYRLFQFRKGKHSHFWTRSKRILLFWTIVLSSERLTGSTFLNPQWSVWSRPQNSPI